MYVWKNKHNGAATAQNNNAAFGNGSVKNVPFDHCYAKFEISDESLTNEDKGRPEIVVTMKF